MGIAKYARVWRTASNVFVGKMVNYKIAEFFPYIDYIMRKTQLNGNVPGIVYGIEAAAAGFFFTTSRRSIIPGFHGHAYYFVSLFVQQHSGHRTVNSAAHGHQHSSFIAHEAIYFDKVIVKLI